MTTLRERRISEKLRSAALRKQLTDDQQVELATLERFGWELKFIRRPAFQKPIAVVYDSSTRRYAVLREDGTLDENPGITIRP